MRKEIKNVEIVCTLLPLCNQVLCRVDSLSHGKKYEEVIEQKPTYLTIETGFTK